jgi:hypothetical protein
MKWMNLKNKVMMIARRIWQRYDELEGSEK